MSRIIPKPGLFLGIWWINRAWFLENRGWFLKVNTIWAYPLYFRSCRISKITAAVSEPKIEKCQILPDRGWFLEIRGWFLEISPDHIFREFRHFWTFSVFLCPYTWSHIRKRAKFTAKLHRVITIGIFCLDRSTLAPLGLFFFIWRCLHCKGLQRNQGVRNYDDWCLLATIINLESCKILFSYLFRRKSPHSLCPKKEPWIRWSLPSWAEICLRASENNFRTPNRK